MPPRAGARLATCAATAPWLRSVAPLGSTVWPRGVCPDSASCSPCSVGKSGLDRGGGMEGSKHGNRGDGGAGEIGRDVLGNGREAQHVDMQHLAGLPRRFEIRARVIPQTEVQAFTGRGLVDYVGVPLELIADRRPDEIRAVRIESVLHHQIHVAQVDIAKIDGDLLGFRRLRPQVLDIRGHLISIHIPSVWMVYGCLCTVCKGRAWNLRDFGVSSP